MYTRWVKCVRVFVSPQSSWHSEAEGLSAQRRSSLSSRSSRKYRATAKSASRIARTIQILAWRIMPRSLATSGNSTSQLASSLLPTATVRRPLAQRAQMASAGQITELTLTGRSWTKGSKMAVQSARPGHDNHIVMEPGSREVRGPGMRASALVLWGARLGGTAVTDFGFGSDCWVLIVGIVRIVRNVHSRIGTRAA